ncbi:MAG: hypothetical protein IJK52_02190 [Oscillospiraceae bacterium]|nr:hypothetical protein [Oscillospiraceae bacterium]
MLAKNDAQFMELEKNPDAEFAFQIIAKGSVLDTQTEWNHKSRQRVDAGYLVETHTIRLNHTALRAWVDSEPRNYDPDWDGVSHEEAERLNKERAERREAFERRIQEDIGFDGAQRGFTVKQIVSEFFAVVTMRRICETPQQ